MKKFERMRNPEESSVAVRTTGRIKKAKVVFDPSYNNLPRSKRASAGSANSNPQHSDNPSDSSNDRRPRDEKTRTNSVGVFDENSCYICRRRDSKKGRANLLLCKDCDHKAHTTCLQLEFENLDKLRINYRCENCQTCSSCFEGREDGELITCTKCVKAFHFACHIPSMARLPTQSKWYCSKCTIPQNKPLLTVLDSKLQSSPTDVKPSGNNQAEVTKVSEILEKKPAGAVPVTNGNKLLQITPNDLFDIPNVKTWSSNDVVDYFKKYFPQEANIFKEHDIDGQSLLLMKRSDVVNKLAIKLGPALRIYNLILKIQSQSTDPTIGW